MKELFLKIVITALLLLTLWYVYATYYPQILMFIDGTPEYTVFFDEVGLEVTVADEPEEWQQGLSRVRSLPDLSGKLFIFGKEGYYGMWMKDMQIPIDMIWINEELEIVHIEKNVAPDTYPTIFRSPTPARFVLETNAHFSDSFQLKVGQLIKFPTAIVPHDMR